MRWLRRVICWVFGHKWAVKIHPGYVEYDCQRCGKNRTDPAHPIFKR